MTITLLSTKHCLRCNQTKSTDEFGVWGQKHKKAGDPRTYCRSCERENSKRVYEQRKARPVAKPETEDKSKYIGFLISPSGQLIDVLRVAGQEELKWRESRSR